MSKVKSGSKTKASIKKSNKKLSRKRALSKSVNKIDRDEVVYTDKMSKLYGSLNK